MAKVRVSWTQIVVRCRALVPMLPRRPLYGVPRGGEPIAAILAGMLDVPVLEKPRLDAVVVDDLVDSGETMRRYPDHDFIALYRKAWSPLTRGAQNVGSVWLVFPWEAEAEADVGAQALRLAQLLGHDTSQAPDELQRAVCDAAARALSDRAAAR
jgi:hypoxanthine phosphoribosyltransferase